MDGEGDERVFLHLYAHLCSVPYVFIKGILPKLHLSQHVSTHSVPVKVDNQQNLTVRKYFMYTIQFTSILLRWFQRQIFR